MRFQITFLIFLSVIFVTCNSSNENKPRGFDNFWEQTLLEMDTKITSKIVKDTIVENKKWILYKINSYKDIDIHAWVSEPLKPGKFPIKIRFLGYGESKHSNKSIPYPWFLKRKNSINMIVDVRGQGLSAEQIKIKNYIIHGLKNKEDYIYRGAYMDAIKAIDFIAEHPKSNSNIIVKGGSQGGAFAIVAAALNTKVTMCVIGFPFMTDIDNYDKKAWPMKILIHGAKREEIDLDELKSTLSYFDMLNFADKINVPIFIRTQETDLVTPKEGTIKFYNRVKSEKKEIYVEPCEGHGCSSKSKALNELEHKFIKANMRPY